MHKKVCVYKRLRLQSSSCGRDLISRCCVAEDSTEFSQVHVARAARLFFLTRPINFLICGVVFSFLSKVAIAPYSRGVDW